MKYLIAIKQLFKVALLGFGLLLPPLGWVFAYYALVAFVNKTKENRGVKVWFNLDRVIASMLYNTKDRTISGITGERAAKGVLGWRVIAKVINFLAKICGDGENHCDRAFTKEQRFKKQ